MVWRGAGEYHGYHLLHEIEVKCQSIIETLKSNDIEGHTRGEKKQARNLEKRKKQNASSYFESKHTGAIEGLNLFEF